MEPASRKASTRRSKVMVRFNRGLVTTNRVFFVVLSAGWFVIVGYMAVLAFDRTLPTEILKCDESEVQSAIEGAMCFGKHSGDEKRRLLTPEIYPGEELRVEVSVIPHKYCDSKVARAVIDGDNERHVLNAPIDFSAAAPAILGTSQTFIYTIPTPEDAAPGNASALSQADFICNWTQRVFGAIEGPLVKIDFKLKGRTAEQEKALDIIKGLLNQ